MEKIVLTREFVYWHGGTTPESYGPGEVEVPVGVAESARLCGAVKSESSSEPEVPVEPEVPAESKAFPQQQADKASVMKKK